MKNLLSNAIFCLFLGALCVLCYNVYNIYLDNRDRSIPHHKKGQCLLATTSHGNEFEAGFKAAAMLNELGNRKNG